MVTSKEEAEEVEMAEQAKLLTKKVSATTVRCGASLVFASVGAGIGATLFRPSAGQWIGKHFLLKQNAFDRDFGFVWKVLITCILKSVLLSAGCAIGDLAGPIIVSACVEKILHIDL